MMKFTRQDSFSEMGLLQAAADHLGSAKVLFDRSPLCFDSAGYLCHIGIELVMKSILLNICNEFPNEHSLANLVRLIEKQDIKMNLGKHHLETVTMLDRFNELRYPNSSNPIEIGDDDWERIEGFFDLLLLLMPERVQNEFKQIDHSVKDSRVLMSKKKGI